MPFRGEEERSGGRVLLFRVENEILELVSILEVSDPVTGINHLVLSKREQERCKSSRGMTMEYDCGGFLLIARGRTLETFKFRRGKYCIYKIKKIIKEVKESEHREWSTVDF